MTLCRSAFTRRARLRAPILAAVTLGCLPLIPTLHAQSDTPSSGAEVRTPQTTVTVFLNNITDGRELNSVVTDLRNMLPRAHVIGNERHSVITIMGTSEEIAEAQKLIAERDKPHRAYRITYTITDTESGKPAASRRLSLVIASGSLGILKQGDRVPLVTGSTGSEANPNSTQVQYIDVGLNIDATLESTAETIHLHSKIEMSSVADEKSGFGAQDPIIRQTQLDEDSTLVPGKPLALGSLDLPDSSRHEEVEVVAELVK